MIRLSLESLEGLPKELASEYAEQTDGTFKFSPSFDQDGYGIDNLAELRGKMAAAESKSGKINDRLQGYAKEDGSLYTLDEIKAFNDKIAELVAENGTLKDKTKTADEKMSELVAQAKGPVEKQLAETSAQLAQFKERALVTAKNEAASQIVKSMGVKPEWEGMLRSEILRHIGAEDNGSSVQTFIQDPESGSKRFSSLTGQNDVMGLEEFAKSETLRTQFGQCLEGDGKQGAGVKPAAAPKQAMASSNFQSKQGDIVLSREEFSNIRTYEAARAQAAESGGQVVMADE